MTNRTWLPFAASAVVYALVTAVLGREVLGRLDSVVTNDAGDPLFTAALLRWNATHVPLTDAWWQFPIFSPTRDTLAFSEHLVGLSVLSSPIYWITRDTLVTYNIVTLLTFPLCALAMYGLVFRLTGSAAGAFVGGLAFGFAPYRVAQLSHVQMLAVFWAPLALSGLHAYVETGRRRWLVLYGATWALQGATNGYSLVLLSVLIGLWVVWFVVGRRNWRALAMIAAATAVAAMPLAPVLYKYVAVHAVHGFGRSLAETRAFSGDISAMLCAPDSLALWGWIRAGCYPDGALLREVELFPGVATLALCGAYVWRSRRSGDQHRPLTVARRLLLAVATTYAAAVCAVLVLGPWRMDLGVLRISATSLRKPLLIGLAALGLAMLLAPGLRAAIRRSPTTGFYLLAALTTWSLALGPTLTFMGVPTGVDGPFAWLLALPGVNSLRVPARFWSMTVLCLSVVAGTSLARIIRGRSPAFARGAVLLAALGVLADGWLDRIPVEPAPGTAPGAALLKGATVIELPPGDQLRDIAATFRAVEGEWTTVNGYSGYRPSYYYALQAAARAEDVNVLAPFRRSGDLHVLVPADASRLTALVERQPGVVITGRNAAMVQYRIPPLPAADVPRALGRRVPVARLRSECSPPQLPLAIDGDEDSVWECLAEADGRLLIVDLGMVGTVGTIVHGLGARSWATPATLWVETSEDAARWQEVWSGSPVREAFVAGVADPRRLRLALAFPPRRARYVRVRAVTSEPGVPWSIAELEVWSGVGQPP